MEIYLTSKFKKSYKRLPQFVKNQAKQKEEVFREDTFNPSLGTHRLEGKYKEYWAFSVNHSWRIMFQFLNAARSKVAFVNIGTHSIYK